ncbi:hypothetical protein [Methanospirillum sp.]|jgi:hypothetical protein|uniref:hypothetical protein n=1 Tax=Methanospirillum sp. TaxID=45200 RepID=UPI0035A08277
MKFSNIKNSLKGISHKDIYPYILICCVYSLTHFLIIFNRGVFWDDWGLFNTDPRLIIERFNQTGSILTGELHIGLLSIGDGIIPYRALTFILFLISSLLLYSMFSNYKKIPQKFWLYLILLIITLPFYSARIALICFPYTLLYTFFIIGCWCTVKYVFNKNLVFLIFALSSFFISFFGSSTIFAFILPLGFVLYHSIKTENGFSLSNIRNIVPYIFISLPIFFVMIKLIFLRPHGFYQNYNTITISHILNIPKRLVLYFFNNFLGTYIKIIPASVFIVIIIIIGSILLFFAISRIGDDDMELSSSYLFKLLIVGIFCFFLAAFPYLLAGKVASYIEWDSRHQLFIPFGMSLIIVSSVYLIAQNNWKHFLLPLIITACLVSTGMGYVDYQRDGFKMESIIQQIQKDPLIYNSTTIIFNDMIPDYNAIKRTYRFYEYTGWLKSAFGDEKRMGVNSIEEIKKIEPYISSELYNMGEYSKEDPTVLVTIHGGAYSIKEPLSVINLLLLNYFSPQDYYSIIPDIIKVNSALINTTSIQLNND